MRSIRTASFFSFRRPHPSLEIPGPPPGQATVPAVPVLAGVAGNTQITLSWNAPANGGSPLTRYDVYQNSLLINQITNVLVADPVTYTLTGLTNGVSATYSVTAVNLVGSSGGSNIVTLVPVAPATVPSAPVLTGVAGDTLAALSWTVPSNGGSVLTGYRLYKANVLLTSPAVGVTTYNDVAVTDGTTYTYTVSAVNAVGEGPKSSVVSVTPASQAGGPTLPANQIVGQASWQTLDWGGNSYVDANPGDYDRWKAAGFWGAICHNPANHLGQWLNGGGELPSETPNDQTPNHNYQRAQEGYAVQGINIGGVPTPNQFYGTGAFQYQKAHEPGYEAYLKQYMNVTTNTGVYPPFHDWWDDAYWANAVVQYGVLARDIKNVLGGAGLGFDPEPANWNAIAPGHTADEQNQKVFDRAYQVAQAYWQAFPDGKMFSYMWNGAQGGYGQWLRGWYYSGDTRLGTSNLGAHQSWYMGWLQAMCDFGSPLSRTTHMQADFYSLGEGGGSMSNSAYTGDTSSYNNRLAKLKLHCEGIMAALSQPFPLGMGTASWSKGCDRTFFPPCGWASGYDTNPLEPASSWMVMMQCDREGSMGIHKTIYTGGTGGAGPLAGNGIDGKWYAADGVTVEGLMTTHLAANQAGAVQTPIPTVVPTCTNMTWTGTTVSCRAAHRYGVIYVKVYNGVGFNPASPESNYLGAMSMVHTHPSLPFYVGIAGNLPGGSNVGASAPSLAHMADSYQQCSFTTTGAIGDWRIIKVVSAKLDVGWFRVQRTS